MKRLALSGVLLVLCWRVHCPSPATGTQDLALLGLAEQLIVAGPLNFYSWSELMGLPSDP